MTRPALDKVMISRFMLMVVVVGLSLTTLGEEVKFPPPAIIPAPVELQYESNVVVRLNAACEFRVECPDAAAVRWVSSHLEQWFGFSPRVVAECDGVAAKGTEGYTLSAHPGVVCLTANTLQGVRYALATLRQLSQRLSEGVTVQGYCMPAVEIRDAPSLAFRGLHLCWFPETSPALIERCIRLAGYYKINTVVLETWGVFRSEKYPWWGWPEGKMTKNELLRLRKVADDLGVTLVPQFNVFGHASMSRGASGKHAVLDLHPEYQPLFELDGWNWCLSNPATGKVIRDLVVEMHEAFGNPPYFHIGCDEADKPSCVRCCSVDSYATLVERHIRAIHDLLASRGARSMMWHDMLLEKGDQKWKPFYANGSREEAAIVDRLPRDIVICDWYYGKNYGRVSEPRDYQTLAYFSGLGFPTVTCPWNDPVATRGQGRYAGAHGLHGLLATTWHHAFKRELLREIIVPSAGAAWGTSSAGEMWVRHWREMGWDMNVSKYSECGFVSEQVPSVTNVEIKPGG